MRLLQQVASQLAPKQQLEERVAMPLTQAQLYRSTVEQFRKEVRSGGADSAAAGAWIASRLQAL